MNRRKPLTILTAALLLCFTLAACGQGTSLSSSPASEPAPHMSGEETNSPAQSTPGAEDGTSATDDMADDDTPSAEETPSDTATTTAPSGDEADTGSTAATTSGTTSTTSRRSTTTRATTTRKTTTTTKPTTTTTTRKTTTTTAVESGNGPVTAQMLSTIEAEFLRLVNEERTSLGLGPLTVNTHLDAAAQVRAGEIMTVFSHTRPDDRDCFTAIDQSKYPYRTVGENIGTSGFVMGNSISSTDVFTGSEEQLKTVAANMFRMFKESDGHYQNIINESFEHTGVGVLWELHPTVGVPVFYFAHFFGSD